MLTERPAPSAEGTLDKRPLAHLLFYAFERRLSGTMEFQEPDGSAFVLLFFEGKLAKARGPGAPAPAEELIARLFDLAAETRFAYFDGFDALASEESAATPLEALPIVWRALRRNPPWPQVHEVLSKIGDAKLRIAGGADLERLGLEQLERHAAGRLAEGALSVLALTNEEILVPGCTQLLVYFLLLTKSAQLAPPDAAAPPEKPTLPTPAALPPEPPSSSGRAFARVRLAKGASAPLRSIEEPPATISASDPRTSARPRSCCTTRSGRSAWARRGTLRRRSTPGYTSRVSGAYGSPTRR